MHISRRSLAISCWTTCLSVGVNGDFSAGAGSAFFSMSRIISISILVARSSAEADLLTSCVITASRLVTCLRLPSTVAVTFSFSAAASSAARSFLADRAGCRIALFEAGVQRRLAVSRRVLALGLGNLVVSFGWARPLRQDRLLACRGGASPYMLVLRIIVNIAI